MCNFYSMFDHVMAIRHKCFISITFALICLMTICSDFPLRLRACQYHSRILGQKSVQRLSTSHPVILQPERKYASISDLPNIRLRGGSSELKNIVRSDIEQILEMLLQPNSTTIKAAEDQLNGLVNRPRFAGVMLDIILDFKAQRSIRQLAGTILRRKIDVVWEHLNADEQEILQESVGEAILTEPSPDIRRQLALSFGQMTKLSNSFSQLDRMVRRVAATCSAEDSGCRALGLEVMQSLVEDLGDEMRSLYVTLVELGEAALTDSSVGPSRSSRAPIKAMVPQLLTRFHRRSC